jgi:ABC-2 type transport system permease protein
MMMNLNKVIYDIKYMLQFWHIGLKETFIDRGMLVVDCLIGTTLPILVQLCFWNYAFSNNNEKFIQNYTFDKIALYVTVSVIIARLNNPWKMIEKFSDQIKSGEFDSYLIKPESHFNYFKNLFYGENIVYLVLLLIFLIPSFYIYSKFIFLIPLLLFLYFSQYICFQMGYIFGLCSFWLINSNFLGFMFYVLTFSLGGVLLPIEFWPEVLQPLLMYNPFRLIVSGVVDVAINPNMNKVITLSLMYIFYYYLFKILIIKLLALSKNVYNSGGG